MDIWNDATDYYICVASLLNAPNVKLSGVIYWRGIV